VRTFFIKENIAKSLGAIIYVIPGICMVKIFLTSKTGLPIVCH